MAGKPLTNGGGGRGERDGHGRFRKGWRGGPGNPRGDQRSAAWMKWMDLATPEKVGKVFNAVYKAACDGDMEAARIFLDRSLGKVQDGIDDQSGERKVAQLEAMHEQARLQAVRRLAAEVNRRTVEVLGIRLQPSENVEPPQGQGRPALPGGADMR
jgi:hypothetical protein